MKRLAILFVTISFTGCMAPKKPVTYTCILDVPREECVCGMSDGSDDLIRHPMIFCDRAIAYIPDEYEKLENYEEELEDYIRTNCR